MDRFETWIPFVAGYPEAKRISRKEDVSDPNRPSSAKFYLRQRINQRQAIMQGLRRCLMC